MQANNLYQPHQDSDEQLEAEALVAILGFGAGIEEKFKLLFQQDRLGKRRYKLATANDQAINILLVNFDNPLAVRKKDILLNGVCANAEIVAVSQLPLTDAPKYHIRGMLTASRLMAVFDSIALAAPAKSLPTALPPANFQPPKLELVQAIVKPAVKAEIEQPVVSAEVKPQVSAVRKYRALVVDDSIAIQKSLELKLVTLEQIGEIDFAESGEAALAMAAENQYHLIFLDVMMPGMDGYQACTELRKNPLYKKTPIIMVSGKTSPLDEVKGIMAGCTTYLTKPVEETAFQKLSLRVLAWLSDKHV
jgi:two-component system, cell cycle response regulator